MESVREDKIVVKEEDAESPLTEPREKEQDVPAIPEDIVKTALPDDSSVEEDPVEVDPYEGLRQDHVVVPREEDTSTPEEAIPPPPPDTVYIIQLAAFSDEYRAIEETEKLSERGVYSRVVQRGNWYQVYASGYDTIEDARAARDRFKTMYPDCYIRKVN